ncbi:RNA-guided endonuclease InsQ/TnpB family protein [Thauera sp. 63]|uniref:RNA-guided endonuclease InsQ/TnpB family protein n=1 Tax=Thauera sp. 63 TaxID=497321 RepID=UPI0002D05821|nr:RNA-guided endonuclease TnpB family protein [Thauera sp. 63]ENO79151.1 transposase [Thauera sp. 63]
MSEGTGFHRAYRYRLRSNRKAEAVLRRWAGCSRKVWNLALAEQQARRERGEKYAGFAGMCQWVTTWRKATGTAYLAEVPVHVLQNVVRALDGAFQRFFRKEGGYPKFKRRGDPIGLRETDVKCFSVDAANGRIRFPKVGWLRYRASRPIEGRAITATLRAEADGWYVSIACAFEPKALERSPKACGIDRGVANFAAFDTGQRIAPLDAHKRAVQCLRRYQRAVARKLEAAKVAAGIPKGKPFPKGFRLQPSNRLRKAQARVAKIHQGIARQRADFLHKLSTQIAREHALVCLEDLKVRSMSASAAGTQEAPGKRVRQKAGLNRSILDQGWSMFKDQLAYKLEWRDGVLVLVHPAYTSQRCHACAHTHADNRKGEVFRCRSCGHTDHADVNAAKNILAAGHAVLAGDGHALVEGQVQSGRPVKREPTEGLRRAA